MAHNNYNLFVPTLNFTVPDKKVSPASKRHLVADSNIVAPVRLTGAFVTALPDWLFPT